MQYYFRYLIPFINPDIRYWTREARLLNWLTFIWLSIGLITLISASYSDDVLYYQDGFHTLKRQMIGVAIGFAGFNFVTQIPLRKTSKFAPVTVLFCLGLIFLTYFVSPSINGAKRWIPVGSLLMQPSELIKPFLVMQSAYIFAKWKQLKRDLQVTWIIIFSLVLAGILGQPNLSTTALCGMSLWLIAIAAELPWKYIISVSLSGTLFAAISVYLNPYQWTRIASFLDPWQDAQGDGYQLVQSLLAIASGGISGSGLGLSQQKLFYLPIGTTDLIFAVYAEEFGFIGCLLLLILLISYATVALRVAIKCEIKKHRLIAVGVMVFLIGQSLINIGVATGSLPTTGLPFPFLSYGTNSIIASLLLSGLLIRVARESSQAKVIPF